MGHEGKKVAKVVEEIGPLLAGFQIAVAVVGFFGIGAVAKWILENWLPFTRWVWSELFAWVHLPEISTAEKDALTTLAFFAPMAVSSLFVWLMRKRVVETELSPVDDSAIGKEIRRRLYATVIGGAFMVVVGGTVIEDTITLFTTEEPATEAPATEAPATEAPATEAPESSEALLDKDVFAIIGVVVSVVAIIGMVTMVLVTVLRVNEKVAARAERWLGSITRFAKPININIAAQAIGATTSIIQAIFGLLSFGTVGGGIIYAAGQLGPIRTVAPLLVLVFLVATIFLNPGRLLRTEVVPGNRTGR